MAGDASGAGGAGPVPPRPARRAPRAPPGGVAPAACGCGRRAVALETKHAQATAPTQAATRISQGEATQPFVRAVGEERTRALEEHSLRIRVAVHGLALADAPPDRGGVCEHG